MTRLTKTRIGFCLVALLAYMISSFGFDVMAVTLTTDASLNEILKDRASSHVSEPWWHLLLAAPFAALALLSSWLARTRSPIAATIVFLIGIFLMGGLWFFGNIEAAQASAQGRYTGAALSLGLFYVLTVPVVPILGVFSLFLPKSRLS